MTKAELKEKTGGVVLDVLITDMGTAEQVLGMEETPSSVTEPAAR